ncbi:hypothetical protein [Tuwongella immobilis]|uniref:Uncharacterized protein n=1 Tax=Tuwongella immobilis TaxID=692036 RepID=A0A6C2YMX0_9BACT|nr:hypothetical protein [Tuwongella immobilis]VIP02559.1 unnamed protein product [Tuwongella immobilis]VTS01766.1 unnamed protein product [Tuwongella immobilis]
MTFGMRIRLGFLAGFLTLLGAVSGMLAFWPGQPLNAQSQPPDLSKAGPNVVKNGDFETGEITPTGWQSIDGLCVHWATDSDPKRGKVIRFDTDVTQAQAYEWWAKLAKGAKPGDAPKKLPTIEPKYDTIAGLDGAWFWSDYFPIEKGQAYWLTIDVKGPAILVWLVGYNEKGSEAFGADANAFQEYLKTKTLQKPLDRKRNFDPFINTYSFRGRMDAGGANEWRTYSRKGKLFRPTGSATPNVKWGRILIYPYWPPGEYFVDNVRLLPVPDPDARPDDEP